jgi:triacylglycerol lipase
MGQGSRSEARVGKIRAARLNSTRTAVARRRGILLAPSVYLYMRKDPPNYELDLVFHPERDPNYVHFENSASNPFEADPAGFPRVNVWWLADSALLTYWGEADATRIFATAGLEAELLKEGSTDCYVAWQNDFVIVAFRGTEPDEWQDMLTNSKIRLVPWRHGSGKVHRGFMEANAAIWPKLEDKLKSLPGRKVWFCGHSLGGALATLAADRYPDTRGVFTIGCPRVGDAAFAEAFNVRLAGKTFRYVNHHDVVTHVPPPFLGYKHVEPVRFIAKDGTISGTPPSLLHFFADLIGTPQNLFEIIRGLLDGTLETPPNFLLEHMPKAYAIWTWNDYDAHG